MRLSTATTLVASLFAGVVLAKLPPLSDEAKAKAAEAASKAAWTDKVGAFQLCKSMDKVAARYVADAGKAGKPVKPTETPACADPGPFTPPGATPAPAPAPAAAPAKKA